ncbi:MAG: transcriptional repressor [Methanobacterium sp.]
MLTEIWGQCPKVKVIDLLISNPQSEYTKTDIANYSGVARSTVYGIIDQLEEYKIIKRTKKVGRSQLYQANVESEITKLIAAFQISFEDMEMDKEVNKKEISDEADFKIKYDPEKGEFIKYKS